MASQERGRKLLGKIEQGDIDGVKNDLTYDVDLSVDRKGITPIHLAARKGFLDILQLLVGAGGDINIKNQNGFAPMHYAAREGNMEVVHFLLKNKADPNVKNLEGDTPLHVLVKFQPMDTIEELVSLGMKVNARNKMGQTPLHVSVLNNRHEATEALMSLGADSNIRDQNKRTPMELCRDPGLIQQMHLHGVMLEAMKKGVVQSQGISLSKNIDKKPIRLKRVDVRIEAIESSAEISGTFYCRREMAENSTFTFPFDKGDEMLSDVYHIRVGDVAAECHVTLTVPIYAAPSDNEDLLVRFNNSESLVNPNVQENNKMMYCTFRKTLLPEYTCIFAMFTRAKLQETNIGRDGNTIISQTESRFKLEIPQGSFEENTTVSLQVFKSNINGEGAMKAGNQTDTVLLTDIYKITSPVTEVKKPMQLTIPLNKTVRTVDDIVLLTADESNMTDERCLVTVDAMPKLMKSSIVYDIPHFSVHVATTKGEHQTNKKGIFERIVGSAERRRAGVFFVVIRAEEDQKSPMIVVECCIADKAKTRIEKWAAKGFKSQAPEMSDRFMLAPYQMFGIEFRGPAPKKAHDDRKVAFLPKRASFQPYRLPSPSDQENGLEGNIIIHTEGKTNTHDTNKDALVSLPFEVKTVKPEIPVNRQVKTDVKKEVEFLMPKYL